MAHQRIPSVPEAGSFHDEQDNVLSDPANVMTRDTGRVFGPPQNHDDLLAELLSSTSLPRLPSNAPEELRRYTVDVKNHKKLYKAHQASRRHGFQALVEK